MAWASIFPLSKPLKSVISTLGFECLICLLVTNKRSASQMLSTQGLESDRQLKGGDKRMHWESSRGENVER